MCRKYYTLQRVQISGSIIYVCTSCKAMNFGIEIFIHIFGEQQSGMNIIYGIKRDVIYWVVETYLVIMLKVYEINTQPLQATQTECV